MSIETTQDAATEAYIKLANLARCRGDLYQIFSTVFQNPTPELVHDLQSGLFVEDFKTCLSYLLNEESIYKDTLVTLENFSKEHQDDDPAKLLRDLRVEYARLFIGMPTPSVSPYETFHREEAGKDGKPLLFVSPTAMSVETYYHETGIKMAINDPPDHISTELEFLFYLCNREAEAWQESNNDQARDFRKKERDFHDEHLGHWGMDFCRKTQEDDKSGFYAALSELLALYLHLEEGGFKPA